jgi:acetoin utilization deacetylase AcuC-like enzyme
MLTVISSSRFADHLPPPGHPERPERADAMATVVERFRQAGGDVVEPRPAADLDLLRVHTPRHLQAMIATRGHAVMLDADTATSPESEAVARLAAGAVLTGVDIALDGPAGSRALAVVRPPGHHAGPDTAMGFCLYNSIAVGAAYARSRGLSRVAIVDYDVHHGNGTQATFYEDPSVLFISSHQFPYYPGTGAASETGRGPGLGATMNLPLEVGALDRDVLPRYEREALPRLVAFRPELLMVSAGFDAHERDPLAGCRMSTEGFRALTALLVEAANRLCEGRVVLVTEGGYDLTALAQCLQAVVDVAGMDYP